MVRSLRSYLVSGGEAGAMHAFCPARDSGQMKTGVTAGNSRRKTTLEDVRRELGDCTRCPLHETRRTIVFGEGNPAASLLFIGEGPGEDEDIQGRPFVGQAGRLLNKIILAMGLKREEVYIANVVKCRPPRNRVPKPQEIEACTPFLKKQIEAISPRIICALGSVAAQYLLGTNVPVSVLRGKFHDRGGIPVMVTFHPAYLLRNPDAKKQVWEDVRKIMEKI